jgi:hypothetical protein
LLNHYNLDATGWGSPFLLVPEATNVDEDTLKKLSTAKPDDYYLSHASPLGVPFNNFRPSSSESQRKMRIQKNRPGSPCYKKFLAFNTEFTEKPICTASREYQSLKIKEAETLYKDEKILSEEIEKITEKDCLCEGLGATALLVNKAAPSHKLTAVAICPGPNLAYFSGIFKLTEMVDHIYGRTNILNTVPRPHVFIKELQLYVDYFRKELTKNMDSLNARRISYLQTFKANLLSGISYYKSIVPQMQELKDMRDLMMEQLLHQRISVENLELKTHAL